MKRILRWFPLWSLLLTAPSVLAQNISITGSCTQSIATLEQGGDPLLTTLNGRPVYYNASVQVDYASSIVNTEAYLFYETAANLGTPEDRWIITFDGQPFYYVISASMTAPTGNYLPFDAGAPVSMCGGTISASPSSPLAVSLLSFQAEAAGNRNLLSWTTASEINHDYFEVERSSNGLDFMVLDKVSSRQGTTQSKVSYAYSDEAPLQGPNYYRLLAVDLNGTHQVISAVVRVQHIPAELGVAYPNPVEGMLTIRAQASPERSIAVEVLDMTGRTVWTASQTTPLLQVNFTALPIGSYWVVLRTSAGASQVLRVHRQ